VRIATPIIAAFACLVSSCALDRVDWYKPAEPTLAPGLDASLCEADASRAFPPKPGPDAPGQVPVELSSPVSFTSCRTYGKITQCTTQVSPGVMGDVDGPEYDGNADNRRGAFESCMTKRGWKARTK
jgi:hypothetical protein